MKEGKLHCFSTALYFLLAGPYLHTGVDRKLNASVLPRAAHPLWPHGGHRSWHLEREIVIGVYSVDIVPHDTAATNEH